MSNTTTTSISKTAKKYLEILATGHIEESQIIAMKSFMGKSKENAQTIFSAFPEAGLLLSNAHNQKGIAFLLKQWKTPTGAERKNNPYGYREQDILENFSHFTLKSLYNAGNAYVDYYIPPYECVATDGATFEYYYNGKINIVG